MLKAVGDVKGTVGMQKRRYQKARAAHRASLLNMGAKPEERTKEIHFPKEEILLRANLGKAQTALPQKRKTGKGMKSDRPSLGRGAFRREKNRAARSARRENRRVFLTAFMAALCLLSFIVGILQADYYCRRTGFGDEETLIHRLTGKSGDLLDFLGSL